VVSTWRRGNAAEHTESLIGCMQAGASGCLFKDVSEQNLLSALLQVGHGRTVIDPRVAGAMLPGKRAVAGDAVLTDREREVLERIARGLTTQEISALLDVSPNTVKSHTRALFTKLQARNRVQALASARERGLL